ncbi:MAG: hypothetical protein FD122_1124 [Stygiobacter sp.]|nr:MAG: hypothetical protein FD122_1124 [Stygiobacter sp.]KAF0215094.1 MAG: hypothetical protein FD178_1920 [Ignavibacteria bacterium]
MKSNPKLRFIVTAYVLVALAVSFLLYGIYMFLSSSVDEKMKDYEQRKQYRQSQDIKENRSANEKCFDCHSGMKGFEASHNPEIIGCSSCHLGNALSDKKEVAHAGMVLFPGNSSNVEKTCGQNGCHPQMIARMQNNIMNTMNGVVSVDKWVFGEGASPTAKSPVQLIGNSPAEKHIRNLCASCHLSNEKTELGPITELSRGGGCLACHLNYTPDAESELAEYLKKKKSNADISLHPQINLNVTNQHCFGCHSRSGRISLSYDGWHETILKPENVKGKIGFRVLDDGRVVQQIKKDVHSEKGMICVDCHTSYEIMGDGTYTLHKEEQMKVQCVDCHLINQPKTQKFSEFDFESKKIAELLNIGDSKKNYLTTIKNGFPLVNVFYESGIAKLIKKSTKETVRIKSPANVCTEGKAHKELSCNTCHNSWTPQCVGCHTEYDENSSMYDLLANKEANGEWLEFGKNFFAEAATLGVKEQKYANGKITRVIDEFTPGMILTIDKMDGSNKIFKRLFAPGFSHTIRKEARSCESCHNNPLALGYGRGKLEYKIVDGKGTWKFTPKFPLMKEDNLPEDAWIGFLKEVKKNSATREYARPFSVSEQKGILTVGACLTCHKSDTPIMSAAILDFPKVNTLKSQKCVLPGW